MKALIFLFMFALGAANLSAQCTAAAPDNFLATTVPGTLTATGTMFFSWTPTTAATGYLLDVTDITTGFPFFNTTIPNGATHTFSVGGIDLNHRYTATIRSICASGCISSAPPETASGGRIVVEDVVFLTGCQTSCGSFPAASVLVNNTTTWSTCPDDNKRNYINFQASHPDFGVCKLKLLRDCQNKNVAYQLNCSTGSCTAELPTSSTIGWKSGLNSIGIISFSSPNNVNFALQPGWSVLFTRGNCQAYNNATGGGTSDNLTDEEAENREQTLLADAPSLSFVPNPAADFAQAAWSLPVSGKVSLNLFDPQGRAVRSFFQDQTFEAGEGQTGLDLAGVSAGIYFLVMETATGRVAQKVVVGR